MNLLEMSVLKLHGQLSSNAQFFTSQSRWYLFSVTKLRFQSNLKTHQVTSLKECSLSTKARNALNMPCFHNYDTRLSFTANFPFFSFFAFMSVLTLIITTKNTFSWSCSSWISAWRRNLEMMANVSTESRCLQGFNIIFLAMALALTYIGQSNLATFCDLGLLLLHVLKPKFN